MRAPLPWWRASLPTAPLGPTCGLQTAALCSAPAALCIAPPPPLHAFAFPTSSLYVNTRSPNTNSNPADNLLLTLLPIVPYEYAPIATRPPLAPPRHRSQGTGEGDHGRVGRRAFLRCGGRRRWQRDGRRPEPDVHLPGQRCSCFCPPDTIACTDVFVAQDNFSSACN